MIEITAGAIPKLKKVCMTVFPVAPLRMSLRRVRSTVSVT